MSHRKSKGLRISMTHWMSHNESYLNIEAARQKEGIGKSKDNRVKRQRVTTVWSKEKEKEKKIKGVHNMTLLGLKSQTTTPKFQGYTPKCLHEGAWLDQWDFHQHTYHCSCLLLREKRWFLCWLVMGAVRATCKLRGDRDSKESRESIKTNKGSNS